MEDQSPQTSNNNLESPSPTNNTTTESPSINEIGLPPPQKPKFQFRSSIIWIVLIVICIGLFFTGYGIGGLSKNNQVKGLRDQIEKLEEEKEKLGNQITGLEKSVADLDLGIISIIFKNYSYTYEFTYTSNLQIVDYSGTRDSNVVGLEENNKTIAIKQ